MKRLYNSKLSYQAVFAIAVCSIFLSLLGGIILIYNSTLFLTEEVTSKYTYVVSDYAHQLEIRIKEGESFVKDIDVHFSLESERDEIFSNPTENLLHYKSYQESVDKISQRDESIYDLFVYLKSKDTLQDMLVVSKHEASNLNFLEIEKLIGNVSLNQNLNEHGFWLGIEGDNDNLLCYLQPIIIDGETVGFTGGRFRTFTFLRGASEIVNVIKSDLFFYNQKGDYLVLNHSLNEKLNSSIKPMELQFEKGTNGVFEYEDNENQDIIVGYSHLSNGWIMVIKMFKLDVFHRAYELSNMLIMLVIIGSIFSIFIALLISSRLTEPIADLAKEVQRIGEGDYNTQLSHEYMTYNNEIGVLAKNVESMRNSISKYIEEIEGNSKNLEILVEERTSQLVVTNKYLGQSLDEVKDKETELILLNDELEQTLENLRDAQEHLIESRKLSALSGLVNGVAHQLNTPIGVVVTAMSFLKEELNNFYKYMSIRGIVDEPVKENFEDLVEIMGLATRNLNKARDILDTFKYITADRSNEKAIELELGEFFRELTSTLMLKAEYRKYALELICENEVIIKSYPSVLTQIMTNLISNSIVHGFNNRDNGNIEINVHESQHNITIEYRDNGHGIQEAHVEQIFDPFFTTQMGKEHIGLGLSIVYNYVVVKMQGSIQSNITSGKGVHFTIQIPNYNRGVSNE